MGIGTLLVRADASVRVGTGHVMRCLALAQAWQSAGGEVIFLLARWLPPVEARLTAEGIGVHHLHVDAVGSLDDSAQTAAFADRIGASWVVVDGYEFGADYQLRLKAAERSVLIIDDNGHAGAYHADLVLNQNLHAHARMYSKREPAAQLLLGPSYALLRREFWNWRDHRRPAAAQVRHVVVTLGGSDPDNVTAQVLRGLQQLDDESLSIDVVIGGSNPHYDALVSLVQSHSAAIHLRRNVDDMAAWMAKMDMAIAAGGSTCWELAYMGIPTVTVVLAENQRLLAEALASAGVVCNLGWWTRLDVDRIAAHVRHLVSQVDLRKQMSLRGQQLVDGEGGHRVVQEMLAFVPLRARLAGWQDERRLFEWANDPLTRRMSFNSEAIAWPAHQNWFAQVMAQQESVLMIVEIEEAGASIPCGQVRVDDEGVVSITLAPAYRGRGLGVRVLRTALCFYEDQQTQQADLMAYIKAENIASQQIFIRLGFAPAGERVVAGQPCLAYAYTPVAGDREQPGSQENCK